jgi:hypothetical protein
MVGLNESVISSEEINRCIAVLTQLNADTELIFDIPKEQRTALFIAAGQLSRPDRDELARRKKTESDCQTQKKKSKIEQLVKKLELDMLVRAAVLKA